jgi:hypothetical protein
VDPRAAEDDAFLEKLANGKTLSEEDAGSPTSPVTAEEGQNE